MTGFLVQFSPQRTLGRTFAFIMPIFLDFPKAQLTGTRPCRAFDELRSWCSASGGALLTPWPLAPPRRLSGAGGSRRREQRGRRRRDCATASRGRGGGFEDKSHPSGTEEQGTVQERQEPESLLWPQGGAWGDGEPSGGAKAGGPQSGREGPRPLPGGPTG